MRDLKFPILVALISLVSACTAQTGKESTDTNKTQSNAPVFVKRVPSEADECWKEFEETAAKVSVKFCGEPRKDILDSDFMESKIKRNSYLVFDSNVNGNARYFLVWFDWKLNGTDEKSLRKFYDAHTSEIVKNDSVSVAAAKEVTSGGMIGRETTYAAEGSNSLTQRVFYKDGKVIILAFMPDELNGNKSFQDKFRQIFFDSLRVLGKQ